MKSSIFSFEANNALHEAEQLNKSEKLTLFFDNCTSNKRTGMQQISISVVKYSEWYSSLFS